MISKKQRVSAFMAAVLFVTVILGSHLFIAMRSEHSCTGEGCSVCEIIEQCEKLLTTVGNSVEPCISHYTPISAVIAAVLLCRVIRCMSTLISLKVELLD